MINNYFNKVVTWLKENAAHIVQFSFNPPASVSDLLDLQEISKQEIPADFISLYKIINGLNDKENMGNLFYALSLYSIEEICSRHKEKLELYYENRNFPLTNSNPEIEKTAIYNPNWIAFGDDGSRCTINLDLSPSKEGTYGQIIFIDPTSEIGILLANSMEELVQNFALDLENNLYTLNEDAMSDGQHYLEANPEIDVINWYDSPKWKHLNKE